MNQFGDNLIAWCESCRAHATRQGIYDGDGVLVGERDPICRHCMSTAELLSAAALRERELRELAEANTQALLASSVEAPARRRTKSASTSPPSVHVSKREAARLLSISRSGENNTLALLIKSGRLTPILFLGKQKFSREEVLKLARTGAPSISELREEARERTTPSPVARKKRARKAADVPARLEDWRPPRRSDD